MNTTDPIHVTSIPKKVRSKTYWLKERITSLGTIWVPMGAISKAAVKREYHSFYHGDVKMHPFPTLADYKSRISELEAAKSCIV